MGYRGFSRWISSALLALLLAGAGPLLASGDIRAARLFGYTEHARTGFQFFPMWTGVQTRHPPELEADRQCARSRLFACHLHEWEAFLDSIRGRSPREQIVAVNAYGNEHKYVLDQDNYGMADFWATPKQFLVNNGDCEDYAIIKYYSLRELGFSMDELRIVVVQDTNLRVPHAVLAVYYGDDVLILDNQAHQVVPHRSISHYVPVYSLNEQQWWMHLP